MPDKYPAPRVASNNRRDQNTVEVEYVLHDGRRVTVAVPYERWRDGGHAPVGRHLADFAHELDLRRERAARRIPD